MSAPTQPAAPEQAHHNNGLFSDHYLNVTLPRRTDWQELASEAGPALQEISGIFAAYTPSNNEAQTETDLIRPVLRALGHDFEVQPALSPRTARSVPTTSSTETRPRSPPTKT